MSQSKLPKENKPTLPQKVAIFSNKNIHWTGVGDIKVGYNIVSQEESEKWLLQKAVRKADPEEVALAYGKNK